MDEINRTLQQSSEYLHREGLILPATATSSGPPGMPVLHSSVGRHGDEAEGRDCCDKAEEAPWGAACQCGMGRIRMEHSGGRRLHCGVQRGVAASAFGPRASCSGHVPYIGRV